jgi:hypothetical protein
MLVIYGMGPKNIVSVVSASAVLCANGGDWFYQMVEGYYTALRRIGFRVQNSGLGMGLGSVGFKTPSGLLAGSNELKKPAQKRPKTASN